MPRAKLVHHGYGRPILPCPLPCIPGLLCASRVRRAACPGCFVEGLSGWVVAECRSRVTISYRPTPEGVGAIQTGMTKGRTGGSILRLSSDFSHLRIGWMAGSARIVSRKRPGRCSTGVRCRARRTSSKARSWYRMTRRTAYSRFAGLGAPQQRRLGIDTGGVGSESCQLASPYSRAFWASLYGVAVQAEACPRQASAEVGVGASGRGGWHRRSPDRGTIRFVGQVRPAATAEQTRPLGWSDSDSDSVVGRSRPRSPPGHLSPSRAAA